MAYFSSRTLDKLVKALEQKGLQRSKRNAKVKTQRHVTLGTRGARHLETKQG